MPREVGKQNNQEFHSSRLRRKAIHGKVESALNMYSKYLPKIEKILPRVNHLQSWQGHLHQNAAETRLETEVERGVWSAKMVIIS